MPRVSTRTGHVKHTHDLLSDLSFDWSRNADPSAPARPPLTVYVPRSTADVVRAVRESAKLGNRLVVRGAGHSSNDLVTPAGGSVLLTEGLDKVVDVDPVAGTVTVQTGMTVTGVDSALALYGLGLQVVPDHPHITVGGFASVGGMSPASLHAGMFVDNVVGAEYVDHHGVVHTVDRDSAELNRLLGGLGRHGIITQLTLRAVPADKDRRVLRIHRRLFTDPQPFIAAVAEKFSAPGDARFARASWIDLPKGEPGTPGITVGALASYEDVPAEREKVARLRATIGYGALRGIGKLSTTLPAGAAAVAKKVATAGLMVTPAYARHTDVERYSDGIMDWSVGEPNRLLVAIAPIEELPEVFGKMYAAALAARGAGGLTYVTAHLKATRSAYLSGGDPDRLYVEVLLVIGLEPAVITTATLDTLVRAIDDICLEHGSFRYMHTRTSKRPAAEAARLDPNSQYMAVRALEAVPA